MTSQKKEAKTIADLMHHAYITIAPNISEIYKDIMTEHNKELNKEEK